MTLVDTVFCQAPFSLPSSVRDFEPSSTLKTVSRPHAPHTERVVLTRFLPCFLRTVLLRPEVDLAYAASPPVVSVSDAEGADADTGADSACPYMASNPCSFVTTA